MVNNAGVLRDATMRKMTLDDFRTVIDIHIQGTWLGTRAAADVMREQGSGSIVNMSSISGKVGNLGQTNYSAAKAGIVGLTKAAAKEVAHLGVRVNAIQPGLIRTPMTEAMRRGHLGAAAHGDPDAAVRGARRGGVRGCFLASDLSSYMTGTVLEVTGGRHMWRRGLGRRTGLQSAAQAEAGAFQHPRSPPDQYDQVRVIDLVGGRAHAGIALDRAAGVDDRPVDG